MRIWSIRVLFCAALALALWLLLSEGPVRAPGSWSWSHETPANEGAPPRPFQAPGRPGPVSVSGGPTLTPTRLAPRRREVLSSIVTVRAPSGTARVGLPVRVRGRSTPDPGHYRITDNRGQVRIHGVPFDGTVLVEALASWGERGIRREDAGRVVGSVAITKAEHEIRCAGSLALDLELVDAVTGRRLDLEVRPELVPAAASESRHVGLLPGQRTTVGLKLPKPLHATWRRDGYVAWDPHKWKVTLSRYARRLSMVYPLRRSARVQVFAKEHDGLSTERAHIQGFEVAGRTVGSRFETSPLRGGFVLHGVPFLRDEPLKVLVVRPPEEKAAKLAEECVEVDVEVVEEADEGVEEVDFEWGQSFQGAAIGSARLPPAWSQWLVVDAVFPEDPDADVWWGLSGDLEISCSSSCRERRDGPRGSVAVTVQRHDGSAAVGAAVYVDGVVGRTDRHGRAVLNHIAPGEHEVRLRERGLVMSSCRVTVRADRTTRTSLREAPGATVHVRVVDAEGEGLPFAILDLPQAASWVDLDESGTQRVDPFTNRDGRRTLARFPAGRWRFVAGYGSRSRGTEVEIRSGAVQTVTLTLPTPAEPR